MAIALRQVKKTGYHPGHYAIAQSLIILGILFRRLPFFAGVSLAWGGSVEQPAAGDAVYVSLGIAGAGSPLG